MYNGLVATREDTGAMMSNVFIKEIELIALWLGENYVLPWVPEMAMKSKFKLYDVWIMEHISDKRLMHFKGNCLISTCKMIR